MGGMNLSMDIKIGNTPLIKIKYRYNGKEDYIYTKLESYNLTGSIKDRVAYYIIKEAYKDGKLKSVEVRELLPELQEIEALKAQIQKNNENIIKLAQIIKEK